MKQKGNLWYFESYQEIRNYLAQGLNQMKRFIYLTTRQRAWIGDYGKVVADCNVEGEPYVLTDEDKAAEYRYPDRVVSRLHSIRAGIGDIEDYLAEDYAVKKPWQVVEIDAPTVVDGFYKAGEHLAERSHTVGQKQTRFTTKELTAVRNPVAVESDSEDVEYLYRITTHTGKYQCHQDSLWWMMLQMEKAEGVSPAKRHVFTIREKDGEEKNVILRLSFRVDNAVSKMKQCLACDELRPVMNHPVIETATGVIVASNGHILTAHKLQGYEQDAGGALPAWARGMLSVPKELCQMKGTVTVEVVEGKWEESVRKRDGSTELKEVSGIIVTATGQGGRQAVLQAPTHFIYPNWRSVIPTRIGPAIEIDTKALAEGVKRIMPQLCDASEMMMMAASEGDSAVELYGQDYDFSKSGTVKVDLPGRMPCGMKIGLNAPLMITTMGFGVSTMHYKSAQYALLFLGSGTLVIQMPMLNDDYKEAPTPPDKKMRNFDVGKWCDAPATGTKPEAKSKPAAKAKASAKTAASHEVAKPSIEDRLRAALREQLAMAA